MGFWVTMDNGQLKKSGLKDIVVLHLRSSGGFYGAEAVILNLAKNQLRQGVSVCVGVIVSKAQGENNALVKRCNDEGIPVCQFDCKSQIDWKTIKEIKKYLVSHNIEIVHSHGYKSNSLVYWLV